MYYWSAKSFISTKQYSVLQSSQGATPASFIYLRVQIKVECRKIVSLDAANTKPDATNTKP
jgi:hypothetical protein